jgi:predicted RND superfamily exporter protein
MKIFLGSLVGALLIALTIIMSLVTVVGLSILANVSLTGFSNMSFVLSVGFAVEYSVHIVARWLRADMTITSSLDRVKQTMSFLMLPTFMSFVSSVIGVSCLAFTDFDFNTMFFFRPLIITMFVTYWFGCYFLPLILTYMEFDIVRLGKTAAMESIDATKEVAKDEAAAKDEAETDDKC